MVSMTPGCCRGTEALSPGRSLSPGQPCPVYSREPSMASSPPPWSSIFLYKWRFFIPSAEFM